MANLIRSVIFPKGVYVVRLLSSQNEISKMMIGFRPLITEKLVHETGVAANLKLSDSTWTLDLRDEGGILEGAKEDADITLEMSDDTFKALIDGSTNTANAYMAGDLKLQGNIMQAMKLSGLFKQFQGAISNTTKD